MSVDLEGKIKQIDTEIQRLITTEQVARAQVDQHAQALRDAGLDPARAKEEYERLTAEITALETQVAAQEQELDQWLAP